MFLFYLIYIYRYFYFVCIYRYTDEKKKLKPVETNRARPISMSLFLQLCDVRARVVWCGASNAARIETKQCLLVVSFSFVKCVFDFCCMPSSVSSSPPQHPPHHHQSENECRMRSYLSMMWVGCGGFGLHAAHMTTKSIYLYERSHTIFKRRGSQKCICCYAMHAQYHYANKRARNRSHTSFWIEINLNEIYKSRCLCVWTADED